MNIVFFSLQRFFFCKKTYFFSTDDSPSSFSLLKILFCDIKNPYNRMYALFPRHWLSSSTSSSLYFQFIYSGEEIKISVTILIILILWLPLWSPQLDKLDTLLRWQGWPLISVQLFYVLCYCVIVYPLRLKIEIKCYYVLHDTIALKGVCHLFYRILVTLTPEAEWL